MSDRSGPAASDRFATTELPGGVRVLTEEMPWVRSASVGVWVRWGSAHERSAELGVSHLLEHMVFKGTPGRSARELALELERLGGSLDAYTTREHTSFQARVLDAHLDESLDVLSDMVLRPLLRAEDLALERQVVLEEIAAVEDTPDDLVFDLHAAALWGAHPYGYSILGTRETIGTLEAEDLERIHQGAYTAPNLIVGAAGNVRHEDVVRMATSQFESLSPATATPAPDPPRMEDPGVEHVARKTSQTHLVFGTATVPHNDPRRYALILLSSALGGGMSSRLFQRVREELGLAYTVYTYQTFYARAGVTGVYVGTRPETAEQAEAVVREELSRVARDGLSMAELSDAKGQVKGQLVLSLESSGARLQRLGAVALYEEPFLTLDELIARVDAVDLDDVAALAAEYFEPERHVVVRLGPET